MQEKKDIDASILNSDDAHALLRVYSFVAELKNLYRQGWLRKENGIPKEMAESVAEHVFSGSLMIYVICREYFPHLDADLALKIFLFHDVGEALAGDITPYDGVSKAEKYQREKNAIEYIFSDLTKKEEYIGYWKMYEEQNSSEAKLAKCIDKFDAYIMANVYMSAGHGVIDRFRENVEEVIQGTTFEELFNELVTSCEYVKSRR